MKNLIFNLGLLTLSASLSSCGSLKIRDKNAAETASIKNVALINMDVIEPRPKELSLNLGSGNVEGDRAMGMTQQKSAQVDGLYNSFARALAVNLKWKVVDKNTMTSNPGFKEAYEKTMKGWQNKMPAGEGTAQFTTKDVLD